MSDHSDKWRLCDVCAKEKGGVPPSWAVTVTKGTCHYCGALDVILTPIVDYRWPKKGPPLWD